MSFKIVADSASDLRVLDGVDFTSVPLTINAGDHSYVDDMNLDAAKMMAELKSHKGRSTTACPNTHDWLTAFGDAEEIVCVTITSALSGSCNAAQVAREDYVRAHPERRVLVVDSLSAGPEMTLLIEKAAELHHSGLSFDELSREMTAYQQHTHLTFTLQSLHNLVANGRVSPAVAAIAGLLNIRIVGVASDEGTLQPTARCRGEKRTYAELLSTMEQRGYRGGKVRITHCCNAAAAQLMTDRIREKHPDADVAIDATRGLCSYYAEEGGMLIGFEG